MSAELVYAGVDVSRHSLELAVRIDDQVSCSRSFPNSPSGIRRLIAQLARAGRPVRVVLEPTSRYHVPLLLALAATPACEVMPVNPWRARRFQQARGQRAKTDRLDARNLARMAEQLQGDFKPYTPPSEQCRELQLLGRSIATYAKQRAKARCRIQSYVAADPAAAASLASLRREIEFCQGEIAGLIQRMREIVGADPQLRCCFELLTGIRGIAGQSALQLLGELLVLPADMQPRQWVACAGLDPRPQQSGQSAPAARISKMGNRYLKQILYMAALTTTQFEPQVKRYYQQLHRRKHSKTLALVVVMRRLLHGIWWTLHNHQPFDPSKCFSLPPA